jgi:hypothetical protein
MYDKLPVLYAALNTIKMPADMSYALRITYGDDGVSELMWMKLEMIDAAIRIDDQFAIGYYSHENDLSSNVAI